MPTCCLSKRLMWCDVLPMYGSEMRMGAESGLVVAGLGPGLLEESRTRSTRLAG